MSKLRHSRGSIVGVKGLVTELRVHGVSGTPPEAMLDDPHPEQVSGDDVGRVFRRRSLVGSALTSGEVDRAVEAFHWGRFTAGSPTRALWLILLPFALVNMARFALLAPTDDAERRRYHGVNEGVLRLIGLGLSLSMVTNAAYLAFDLLAVQCPTACSDAPGWLGAFVERPLGVRLAAAAVIPALVVLVLWVLGSRTFLYEPPGPSTAGVGPKQKVGEAGQRRWTSKTGSFADPSFWQGAANADTQRAAHVLAACGLLGALVLIDLPESIAPGMPGWLAWSGWLLLAGNLLGFVVGIGMVVRDPQPPEGAAVAPYWVISRRVGAGLAVVSLGHTSLTMGLRASDTASTSSLFGFEAAANVLAIGLGLLLVVLLVGCLAATTDAAGKALRHGTSALPVPGAFRPFWLGFGAWMLTNLAVALMSGFGTAVVFWFTNTLGRADVEPAAGAFVVGVSYWTSAALWGAGVVMAALGVLPTIAWVMRKNFGKVLSAVVAAAGVMALGWAVTAGGTRTEDAELVDVLGWFLFAAGLLVLVAVALCVQATSTREYAEMVKADYVGSQNTEQRAASAGIAQTARQWRTANARYRYHHASGAIVVGGSLLVLGAAAVAAWRVVAASDDVSSSVDGPLVTPLIALGVAIVSSVAVGLFALGLATWRNPAMRTATGIVWDLVSFWPRTAHPLCPPPYGGRAVLGVAQRADELYSPDLGARSIVLSGHSQGAVVTMAATALLSGRTSSVGTMKALAMVTYGSQLQFIFSRLFPSFLGYEALHRTYESLGGRWRNLYRWTDPLGGPVLSWPASDDVTPGPDPDQQPDPEQQPRRSRRPARGQSCGPGVPCWATFEDVDARIAGTRLRMGAPSLTPSSWWVIGPDVRLLDPDLVTASPHYPRSPLRGHSDYPADPVFDAVVTWLGHRTATWMEAEQAEGEPVLMDGQQVFGRGTQPREIDVREAEDADKADEAGAKQRKVGGN